MRGDIPFLTDMRRTAAEQGRKKQFQNLEKSPVMSNSRTLHPGLRTLIRQKTSGDM